MKEEERAIVSAAVEITACTYGQYRKERQRTMHTITLVLSSCAKYTTTKTHPAKTTVFVGRRNLKWQIEFLHMDKK